MYLDFNEADRLSASFVQQIVHMCVCVRFVSSNAKWIIKVDAVPCWYILYHIFGSVSCILGVLMLVWRSSQHIRYTKCESIFIMMVSSNPRQPTKHTHSFVFKFYLRMFWTYEHCHWNEQQQKMPFSDRDKHNFSMLDVEMVTDLHAFHVCPHLWSWYCRSKYKIHLTITTYSLLLTTCFIVNWYDHQI